MTPYITTDEADIYFAQERLNSQLWFQTPSDHKLVALKQATRAIDRLNFVGEKTDAEQELEFPRSGDTEIPRDIEIACMELAFAYLDGADVEMNAAVLNESAASFVDQRTRKDTTWLPEAQANNIVSAVAWQHLRPYLETNRTINLSRVD